MKLIAENPIVSGAEWFVQKPVLDKSLAWQEGMMAVILLLVIGGLFYIVGEVRRTKQWFPVYVGLGGAIACFYEPLGDLLTHVTYHEVNQINLTTAFGFRTPLWILPTYLVSFGTPILLFNNMLANGVTLKKWMTVFFIAVPSGWAFEVPMLEFGFIDYYGDNQPFKILGFPVWLAFVNNATLFVTAALLYLLKKTVLLERWPYLVVVLVPIMVAGTHAGLSLPAASALNGPRELLTVNAMALLSTALAILVTWIAGVLTIGLPTTKPHGATLKPTASAA